MVKRKSSPTTLDGGASLAETMAALLGEDVILADGELESKVTSWISTQCATLDYAMRMPGVPTGKLTTIIGKEGASKSSVTYHLIAECQRMGGIALLVDAEKSYDPDRGARIGVDNSQLIVVQSRSIEAAYERIEKFVDKVREADTDIPVLIVVDSLTRLPALKILEAEEHVSQPALVSRYISSVAHPRILPKLARGNIALVVINQLRTHIDMNTMRRPEVRKVMGDRWGMIAELPLIYDSSLILHLSSIRPATKGDDKEVEGVEVRARVAKCKVSPGEGNTCEYTVLKWDGIDRLGSEFDLLVDLGIIKANGAWFAYEPYGKSFHKADYDQVREACPELEQIVKDAPIAWASGGQM